MPTFLATLVVFFGVVAALAVGLIVDGRRLRGSCGSGSCTCSPFAARACPRRNEAERSRVLQR